MKKYIALLLAIVLCLTVLAGCASQQTPDVSEPEDTTPEQTATQTETPAVDETAETQDVELWYYWETESHQITLQAAIDAYNASQTAYKVTAKYVPFADFKKQLSIGAVAEALPDMVILDSPDHASYASMGIFADITGKIDVSGYFEGPVNSCTYDGKLYGYPNSYNVISMWYSKPIFEQNGIEIPTTFEEFEAACDKLVANGVTPISTAALYGWHTMRLVELLVEYYAGAELHDQLNAMQASWDCPEVIQALTKYQEWSQKGYFPEGFLTADPDTTRYSVFSGKAAMDIDGQWFDSYIIDDGMNMDDFGTFVFPEARLSSFVEMFQFDKNISDAELNAVMEFLDFYMGDEFVNEHSSGYNMPLPVQGSKAPADQVHIDGIFAVSDEVGSFTVTDEALPSEVIDTLFNAQSAIANNEMTPAEGAAAIQASIEAYQAS